LLCNSGKKIRKHEATVKWLPPLDLPESLRNSGGSMHGVSNYRVRGVHAWEVTSAIPASFCDAETRWRPVREGVKRHAPLDLPELLRNSGDSNVK
jgi:hypothetical protein